MVTETDRAVEAALVTGIRGEYPHHQFIGEEDTAEAKGGNVGILTGKLSSAKWAEWKFMTILNFNQENS